MELLVAFSLAMLAIAALAVIKHELTAAARTRQ
jgi:hypothetical protein